ncbi:hypothetical protein PSHT_07299 [Puccinia striiformis]|uniref:tRNA (adenine(58)-N(1))-methyltransferase non-catalytic subunit TRM6 n=1 Tax=Puccinia striiformis TaxID=27350 RepID=A0A2S4VZE5_9BASI|nr:hypothetical protein PSHT_07299 [Puccinia striiformis]
MVLCIMALGRAARPVGWTDCCAAVEKKPNYKSGMTQPARTITAGDNLLLKLPSGQTRTIKNVTSDSSISLGKFGKFQTNELIDQPFGLTFDILEDGKLVRNEQINLALELNPMLDELNSFESIKGMANGISNVEDIEATNEMIKESDGAQKLTNVEIEELKKSGLSGREIILRQIQQHSAFELKSEFSKAKYIKRKEKKFLKMFTCIDPTIHNMSQYLFENHNFAIKGLRPDTLSQMLSLSNVRPGWKGIVVDDIGGLLVAAVLIRMGGKFFSLLDYYPAFISKGEVLTDVIFFFSSSFGSIIGEGTIFVLNNADSPPDLHLLELFNLPKSVLGPLKSLNWAQTEADWTTSDIEELLLLHRDPPQPLPILDSTLPDPQLNQLSKPPKKQPNNRSKSMRKFERVQELLSMRQEFLDTQFEGLLTCSEYEPESIVTKLVNKLSGSSTIVIYSCHLRPLSDLQTLLKKSSMPSTSSSSLGGSSSLVEQNELTKRMKENKTEFIQITISEPWLRAYQVLVGRTHPEMAGTHHGGFVFSAIKRCALLDWSLGVTNVQLRLSLRDSGTQGAYISESWGQPPFHIDSGHTESHKTISNDEQPPARVSDYGGQLSQTPGQPQDGPQGHRVDRHLRCMHKTSLSPTCVALRQRHRGHRDAHQPKQMRQLINQAHQIQSASQSKKQELWEIQADQIDFLDPAWQKYVPDLSKAIGVRLGVELPIRLHLEKMLIYGPGAGSEPQTDSPDRTPGMFGTLMIVLPSTCTGGTIRVKHNEDSMDLGTSDGSQYSACWYSDVSYEVLPLRSGYQCILVYNLALRPDHTRPTANSLNSNLDPLRKTIELWQTEKNNESPKYLFHAFNHQSTETLEKGPSSQDILRAQSMQHSTRRLPFELFWSFLEKKDYQPVNQEWDSDDDYPDCMAGYEYDEFDGETTYTMITLRSLSGTTITDNYHLDIEPELVDDLFDDVDPREEINNEGITYRYRRWALVIVPHVNVAEFLAHCTFGFSDDIKHTTSADHDHNKSELEVASDSNLSGTNPLLPSAQTTMLDTINKMYKSQQSPKLQMTDILESALQYSHYTLFQTVGAHHQGCLPIRFFDSLMEWLSNRPDAERSEKYNKWLPMIIEPYPSMTDLISIIEKMSNLRMDGTIIDTRFSTYSTWAQDLIRRCIKNFPDTNKWPTIADGKHIADLIFDLKEQWAYKSALLMSIVNRFPQIEATAFLLALLHQLMKKASKSDLSIAIYQSLSVRIFNKKRQLSDFLTKLKARDLPAKGASSHSGLIVTPKALVTYVRDVISLQRTQKLDLIDPFIHQFQEQVDTFSREDMRDLWLPFIYKLNPVLHAQSICLETPIYQQLTSRLLRRLDDVVLGPAPDISVSDTFISDELRQWRQKQAKLYATLTSKIPPNHLESLLGAQEAFRIQSIAKLAPVRGAPPPEDMGSWLIPSRSLY